MSFEANIPGKIMDLESLQRRIHSWKMLNDQIVFTNGVFDLMHRGHVDYLMKAADHGDRLIIGLNSDQSVKLLNKGSNRPLQDQDSRALILASLAFVSAVVVFDDETPKNLIEALSPDVLVKGGDYEIKDIAGSDYVLANGGQVFTIPIVEGFSTSNIEAKIRKA